MGAFTTIVNLLIEKLSFERCLYQMLKKIIPKIKFSQNFEFCLFFKYVLVMLLIETKCIKFNNVLQRTQSFKDDVLRDYFNAVS